MEDHHGSRTLVRRSAVRVRRADPLRDRQDIVAVLRRNMLGIVNVEARHEWLYLRNPWGRAWVWLAEDTETGTVVGTSAAHPKRVRVDGRTLEVLDLSDFAVDATHRTLGPALALLRATLEPMRGRFAFSYDHPSPAMLAVYTRLGGRAVSQHTRWVRLLRISPQIDRRIGPLAGSLVGKLADLALAARDTFRRSQSRVAVKPLAGEPGREFDRLDEETADQTRVRGVRSAAHLAWRYLGHTAARHEILCARDGGALVGYLVFRPSAPQVLSIVDVVARAEPDVGAALIAGLVALGRARGIDALWATVLDGGPVEGLFPRCGFVPRERSPGVVVYAPEAPPGVAETISEAANWWMLEGDADV
ncbi:MAG TPA: GNAT family N-acetyltransferase [Candidatus Limnocylindria bacterium]|nr:GNAT family N-acetyltransferase [Candidatus Limnocylindria bacterium]